MSTLIVLLGGIVSGIYLLHDIQNVPVSDSNDIMYVVYGVTLGLLIIAILWEKLKD